MDLPALRTLAEDLRAEIARLVVGQEQAVDLLLIGLLSGGHILLEGVPGTGKTLLAQSFGAGLSLECGRIQFTPDMMPGDVLGTSLFNFQTSRFTFAPGPIFTQILLADEINRSPPKTQAALLQAMAERTVTIDGHTHALGDDFMVVATENPIEQQGTYPLPEAQLDRFMFKVVITYPTLEQERAIVRRHGHRAAMPDWQGTGLQALAGPRQLAAARGLIAAVRLSEAVVDYVVAIIRATRGHAAVATGASPRAAIMLTAAARAHAALHGRDFVIPDDIKILAPPLLRHRLVLSPAAEIDGITTDDMLREILDQIPAPR